MADYKLCKHGKPASACYACAYDAPCSHGVHPFECLVCAKLGSKGVLSMLTPCPHGFTAKGLCPTCNPGDYVKDLLAESQLAHATLGVDLLGQAAHGACCGGAFQYRRPGGTLARGP